MQTMNAGLRGVGLLVMLNWDRALFLTAVGVALLVSTWLGTILPF